jgi:hypothetical protein
MVVHFPLLYDNQYRGSCAASAQSLRREHLFSSEHQPQNGFRAPRQSLHVFCTWQLCTFSIVTLLSVMAYKKLRFMSTNMSALTGVVSILSSLYSNADVTVSITAFLTLPSDVPRKATV